MKTAEFDKLYLIQPEIYDRVLPYLNEGYLPRVFEEFTSKKNASLIFVSQSIFVHDKNFIRMSQNSHYVICMQNRRNPSRIRALAT